MGRFSDLNPEDFRGGTVFLDIDGTLVPDGEDALAPREAQVLSSLASCATVYLIASKGFARIPALAEAYGARPIVTDALKPSLRITEGIGVPPHSCFVIGDKIMTDGWFASRIHARFVPVTRLVSGEESLFVSTLYALDAVIWALVSLVATVARSTPWLYIRIARPNQWWKNLLMLLPAFLAGTLWDARAAPIIFGIIAFSASASVSYVVNDIIDCNIDAKNPQKRGRPIACGLISIPHALIYACFLALIAIAASAKAPAVIPWVMGYLALTHVYTFYFKRFPVIELFAVSGFYVLRVLGGAAVGGIVAPGYLLLLVFFSSLLTAAGGRYADSQRTYPRAVIKRYPSYFLKLLPILCAMLTLFTYILAAFMRGAIFLSTVPIATFIIVWYLHTVYRTGVRPEKESRLWDSIVLWFSILILLLMLDALRHVAPL